MQPGGYDDVSNWDACMAKIDCIPLGNGQYLCNPSETGEAGETDR